MRGSDSLSSVSEIKKAVAKFFEGIDMFYATLMEKRAKRNVNAPDVMLARQRASNRVKF